MESEERGQGWAIAENLLVMAGSACADHRDSDRRRRVGRCVGDRHRRPVDHAGTRDLFGRVARSQRCDLVA